MAKQHTKGNGVETTNGDIPVVAPINMGKGLHWNGSTDQYEVKIAEQQPIKINDNGELEFRVSNLEDNLLKIRDGALYVGTKADDKVANLYVDAVNGVDQDPYKVDGAGTRAKPLRTLAYAISLKEYNTQNTIWLMENQDHVYPVTSAQAIKKGKVEIRTYGSLADATIAEWKDWYQVYRVLLEQEKEARIIFQGLKKQLYDGPQENFYINMLRCLTLYEDTHLSFYGVRLVNDLDFTLEREINKSNYGSRQTLVNPMRIALESESSTLEFHRVRFSSVGQPRVVEVKTNGTPNDSARKGDLYTKDDKGLWYVGLFYGDSGGIALRGVKFDNLQCYLFGPQGWMATYGTGLTLTALNDLNTADVVRHVTNNQFEELGNGVKRLLTPSTNIPTQAWL